MIWVWVFLTVSMATAVIAYMVAPTMRRADARWDTDDRERKVQAEALRRVEQAQFEADVKDRMAQISHAEELKEQP